jgi:CDP-glucose 4,6-dehydratase
MGRRFGKFGGSGMVDDLFGNIYDGKKVLITGHTGFKGSWLALWLIKLGADVVGYSLEAPSDPSHFNLLKPRLSSVTDDILNKEKLSQTIKLHQPEIVFHLAAQALVRDSYARPVETFETNIMGTINVLESCRQSNSVKAIVNVTSDKCYQNNEWLWGYRENEPMGGHDPYSASKGAAELVANAYRRSFFNPDEYGKSHTTLLADVRTGNVIGGGDWAKDRLIPDIMRAASRGETVPIRSPRAIRPWQHVLEPLSGYLQIGQQLLAGKKEFADNWNFGPTEEATLTVLEVIEQSQKYWDKIKYELKEDKSSPHEASLLKLDSSKARLKLHWQSIWNNQTTFEKTINWYKWYYQDNKILTKKDLDDYIRDAKKVGASWVQTI